VPNDKDGSLDPEERRNGAPPAARLPDFFIVGHPKSGTTALYEMLRAHPQIFMPDLKEPRYFASDLRPRFQPQPADPSQVRFPETLEEYLALFEAAEDSQTVGEASPSYLRSSVAAGAIAQAQPTARVIALLREPASFLRSLHLELVQNHVEREKDFRKAFAKEDLARRTSTAQLPRYSDRVRYVEQLRRYRAVFPPEQVLVLIYDDFRQDNEATVREVLRFLQVDDTAEVELVEANPTVAVRSVRFDHLVRAVSAGAGPLSRTAKSVLMRLLPNRLRGDALQAVRRRVLYSDPPPVDEEFMQELRLRFKDEVVALSEYLGRDLVGLWGYEDLG
jgi:hypothetical protein